MSPVQMLRLILSVCLFGLAIATPEEPSLCPTAPTDQLVSVTTDDTKIYYTPYGMSASIPLAYNVTEWPVKVVINYTISSLIINGVFIKGINVGPKFFNNVLVTGDVVNASTPFTSNLETGAIVCDGDTWALTEIATKIDMYLNSNAGVYLWADPFLADDAKGCPTAPEESLRIANVDGQLFGSFGGGGQSLLSSTSQSKFRISTRLGRIGNLTSFIHNLPPIPFTQFTHALVISNKRAIAIAHNTSKPVERLHPCGGGYYAFMEDGATDLWIESNATDIQIYLWASKQNFTVSITESMSSGYIVGLSVVIALLSLFLLSMVIYICTYRSPSYRKW